MRIPRVVAFPCLVLATTLALAPTLPSSSATTSVNAERCPNPEDLSTVRGYEIVDLDELSAGVNVIDCSLVGVIVSADGGTAGVEIPEPGRGVELITESMTEDDADISVFVSPDGQAHFEESAPEPEPGAASPHACVDTAWSQTPQYGPMSDNEELHYNSNTFPSYLNQSQLTTLLLRSFQAWPSLYSDCSGVTNDVSATLVNAFNSTAATNVTPLAQCADNQPNNTYSQVEFGTLPSNIYGATCRYTVIQSGRQVAIGSDVRMSSSVPWTLEGEAAGCSNRLDFRSVMTHEAGHFWGLGHVDPAAHPNLTMRGGGVGAVRCNGMLRTLGRGDIVGMRTLY